MPEPHEGPDARTDDRRRCPDGRPQQEAHGHADDRWGDGELQPRSFADADAAPAAAVAARNGSPDQVF